MPKKAKYSCLPSKRNGHVLTQEDRVDITKNFVDACSKVMGFSYSNLVLWEDTNCAENIDRQKQGHNYHST